MLVIYAVGKHEEVYSETQHTARDCWVCCLLLRLMPKPKSHTANPERKPAKQDADGVFSINFSELTATTPRPNKKKLDNDSQWLNIF